MPRRGYSGAAKATRLSLAIDANVQTLVVEDPAGWPDGTRPFFLVLERGTANEEKVLVGVRNGSTFQNLTRGADGTAALSHQALVAVEHVWTATDADESNAHVNTDGPVHGAASQIVGVDDVQTLTGKTIDAGANTITGLTTAMIPGLDAKQTAQDAATAQVQTNLNAEAVLRASGDSNLDSFIRQVDQAVVNEANARLAADNLKYDKAGGAISGNVTVGGTLAVTGATSVPAPTAATHASTKKYVDDEINKIADIFYGTGAPPTSGFKQGDLYLRYT
jgi:hypothetical protein